MNPVSLLLIAAILVGIALWFNSRVSVGRESSRWFLCWLITGSLSALCGAASWWITDPTISTSFFLAYRALLSITLFFLFLFARSFSAKTDFTIFFWSLPLQLDIALIIVNNEALLQELGGSYVLDFNNAFAAIHLSVFLFYSLFTIFYFLMVYRDLRRAEKARELRQVKLFIAALAMMIPFMVLEAQIRFWLEINIPVGGVGIIIGAFIIVLALRGATLEAAREK